MAGTRATAFVCALMLWAVSVAHADTPPAAGLPPLTNQLKNNASPYLALHGDDPVAWQEWNAATVARARQEGKLLFVSIGYFSCHWCHVMQRESYRDRDIARFLNKHFIPVKVDRELEPALDARMIEFVEATRGLAGWPLNVFVTPEGHPVYATLYHPPADFQKILQRVDDLWTHNRANLADMARAEASARNVPIGPPAKAATAIALADQATRAALEQADTLQGGFGQQGKFPLTPRMIFLLVQYERTRDEQLGAFLRLTLDAMADKGLRDHLGGGFFRYTIDPSWNTPHFEKMLYDNAQLAQLYFEAARVFASVKYRRVAIETVDFMLREMRLPNGGFIAALSAVDGRGVEGGTYLWSAADLDKLLTPDEREVYGRYAGMQGSPPFANGYLPVPVATPDEIAASLKREPQEVADLIASAQTKLHDARNQRSLPRDTKELAAWNGLALLALTAAARDAVAYADARAAERYREAAQGAHDYLANVLWNGTGLARARVDGRATGHAALEDYACAADALTEWAALTADKQDLVLAKAIVLAGWQRFYGAKGWRIDPDSLIEAAAGQNALRDGATGSASGRLIDVSLRLAAKTQDTDLRSLALGALQRGADLITDDPLAYTTQIAAMARAKEPSAAGASPAVPPPPRRP
jgi:uncharacterized protein YyaL (SSP411 family)